MKKVLVFSTVVLLLAGTAGAQSETALKQDQKTLNKEENGIKKKKREARKELRKLEGTEVAYQSKQAFYEDFGNVASADWKRTRNFDEVTFSQNGQSVTAYYDASSKLVGTTSVKSFNDLPSQAQQIIDNRYAGYVKGPVVYFNDNEANETDMIFQGTQFEDADNYFIELSKDGKTIVLQITMDGEVMYFTTMK